MLNLSPATKIYLSSGVTDMRKSFNGLAAIVQNEIQKDLCSGHLFVFCNRLRNRLKILFWDGSGLWVFAKRLEKGTFAWPQATDPVIEMTYDELTLLLSGIDISLTKKRRWFRR